MTCEMNNMELRVKFVFSPDIIFCGRLGSKHQLTNHPVYTILHPMNTISYPVYKIAHSVYTTPIMNSILL